jgi:predicted O-methyltransferase YrrM
MQIKPLIKSLLGMNRPPEPATKLPRVDLSAVVREFKPDLKILEPASTNGNATIQELLSLNFIVAACSPKVVFEIGTFDGRTTLNLAANSPADARLFTLDLPAADLKNTKFAIEEYDRLYVEKPQSGARFQGRPEAGKITQLFGDSATFDFSPYFNSVDFVFVDGSHAYEYARNDSHVALKLLRNKKGMIVWHDYGHVCWPGVVRALDEFAANDPAFKNIRHITDTTLACLRLD